MPTRYPIIGDLDKPFHLPECECSQCEAWRDTHYVEMDRVQSPGEDLSMKLPAPLEREIQTQCVQYLNRAGIFAWRANTGGLPAIGAGGRKRILRFGIPGASDIQGVLPDGRFLAVEVKRPGSGKASAAQDDFLGRITRAGGLAIVVRSVDDLRTALKLEGYEVP